MEPDYDSMILSLYKSVLVEDDIVIDVGANVGRHTLEMSLLVGDKGRVLSFEPLESAFKSLCELVLNNNKQGVVSTYNVALGDVNGVRSFVSVKDFPEYSGFKERMYHCLDVRKEVINIPVRALDSYLTEIDRCKLIKFDCEGGELLAMKGAWHLISKFKPVIVFELGDNSLLNYPYTAYDYFHFLDELGYVIKSITGETITKESIVKSSREQEFWDYVACAK